MIDEYNETNTALINLSSNFQGSNIFDESPKKKFKFLDLTDATNKMEVKINQVGRCMKLKLN